MGRNFIKAFKYSNQRVLMFSSLTLSEALKHAVFKKGLFFLFLLGVFFGAFVFLGNENIVFAYGSPFVDLKINNSNGPLNVSSNAPLRFSWTSTNADFCYAYGDSSAFTEWRGLIGTSGSKNGKATSPSREYNIFCGNNSQSGLAKDSVVVNISGYSPEPPDPSPSPGPAPPSSGYCSVSYLSKFWNSSNLGKWYYSGMVEHAASVCMCESGGNPNARLLRLPNEDSRGLFQINIKAHPGVYNVPKLYEPEYNIMSAIDIFKKRADWLIRMEGCTSRRVGWQPWSCAKPPFNIYQCN